MTGQKRTLVVTLLGTLMLPGSVTAQGPALAAFRDSVDSVRDMTSLRRMAAIDERTGTDAWLRRGISGLRLYELTGVAEDLFRARDAFETAARHDPALAWAQYGIGLTWYRDPELVDPAPRFVAGRALREAMGRDPRSRARRALRMALQLAPDLTEAAVLLADLAAARRHGEDLELARVTLDRATAEGRADPDASLALAEVALMQRDFDAALPAAERAAYSSDAAPSARYVLALALFGGSDLEAGAREYFAAAAAADPGVALRMYGDIRAVANEIEVAEWEAADPAGRRAWLRSFWDIRAALAGVSVPERIAEHFRRYERALEMYPRRRKYGAPPANALLLDRPDLPVDDRGIILIRHGEPADIIRSAAALQNESWAYPSLDGGYRLLHFVNYGPLGDGSAAGNPGASAIDGEVGQGYAEFVLVYNLLCDADYLADRVRYDRRLRFASCNDFDRRSVSAEVRQDAYTALRTDSHAPDFAKQLPLVFDGFAFRGSRGLTELTTAVALPASELQATTAGTTSEWGIRASLILADTTERRITRLDTTLIVRKTGQRAAEDIVLATFNMAVVPGRGLAQRLVVRDAADSAAGGMVGGTVDVPDFYGDSLMLSDIVLAERGVAGAFRRGTVSLRLVPTREYGGGAFSVFYEVYNLAADRPYSTELLVEREGGGVLRGLSRLFGGGGPEVRLRFDGRAMPEADGAVREVREVATNLPPGRYRLKIRVTDEGTRRSVTRERPFTVVAGRERNPDGI